MSLTASVLNAAQADNRIRAWYVSSMAVGLLYECSLGDIKPDCPVGERAGSDSIDPAGLASLENPLALTP